MWADTDTDVDYLNYTEVAELVAEMVGSERMLPLSLGVFGTWGTGKSSILRLVQADLAAQDGRYVFVEFDAWLYQDFDDARAALMAVIAKVLLDAAPEGLKDKAKSLYGRVNKLRFLGLAAEGGAAFMGLPTFGLLRKGIEGIGDYVAGDADDEDAKAVKDAAGEVREKTKGLLAAKEKRSPPEEITAFRAEFKEVLRGLDKTLVVVIDNIDRCTPPNAIHTLEAIRLFLFLPRTAFVIAADEDMVRHAVSTHFRNPSERLIQDYLDKLIQVPVRVPRLGVQEVRAYMLLLFAEAAEVSAERLEALRSFLVEQLRQAWRPDAGFGVDDILRVLQPADPAALRVTLDLADRMAPLLAYSANVKGNPRIIKRMLNVVRMRASVARKRGMPIDEAIIAKFVLFERCTAAAAVDALHDAINASAGKPEFFALLEDANALAADTEGACPEPMRPYMTFIRDWSALEPPLADIDLRPAVYLARETVPLRSIAAALSPAALRAVDVLRDVRTASSPAARDALAAVDAIEHVPMMDALVRDMRRNPDWMRSRRDFLGATLLADIAPEAAVVLVRFVRSLELPRRPPWMSALLAGKAWAEG
ncbi:KAP family P-loop NTPase fold protein [Methylorubrum populi]|uniref:KAP family P-loop NTPase fold protein n=1 Tax=Methylorubrum populi TaxID=223967 RepID=UPI003F65C272